MTRHVDEVEDVWAIVRERDSLRVKVRRLETENRHLRAIIAGYTGHTQLKPEDTVAPRTRGHPSVMKEIQ